MELQPSFRAVLQFGTHFDRTCSLDTVCHVISWKKWTCLLSTPHKGTYRDISTCKTFFFFLRNSRIFKRQQVSLEKYFSSLWLINNYHNKYKITLQKFLPEKQAILLSWCFLPGSWIQVTHSKRKNKLPFSHHPQRITSNRSWWTTPSGTKPHSTCKHTLSHTYTNCMGIWAKLCISVPCRTGPNNLFPGIGVCSVSEEGNSYWRWQ